MGQTLYGSSRLGMWRPNLNLADVNASADWGTYGKKFFELSNHLGNVMAVINDKQVPVNGGYDPEVINSTDYYAFGGQMPGRSVTLSGVEGYRYGFNGKENDNEVKGTGNQQDYGMRIYDPRIAKFLSVDPLQTQFPWYTPYQFAGDSPIGNIDLDGLEAYNYHLYQSKNSKGEAIFKIASDGREEESFLNFLKDMGRGFQEQHVLNYRGKPIASFSSFQEMKQIVHGKKIAEFKGYVSNEISSVDAMTASNFQEHLAESYENPSPPTFNSPLMQNKMLQEAEEEEAFTPMPLRLPKQTISNNINAQTTRGNSGNTQANNDNKARQLKINRDNSINSESLVYAKLKSSLKSDEIIISKPRIYIGDGTDTKKYAVPDFAIYNVTSKKITSIVDAKNGNGPLTGRQNELNEKGGVFKGTSRNKAAAAGKVDVGIVKVERTNVSN